MASGDTLLQFLPNSHEPSAATYATGDVRNQHPTLDFALAEITRFTAFMPAHYAGGGVTIDLIIAMTSAVADDVNLETAFERIGEVLDIDGDSFAAAQNTGDVTVPGASGVPKKLTSTHSDGAQMDSVAVGELFRLQVQRVAVGGTDATGDLELLGVLVSET